MNMDTLSKIECQSDQEPEHSDSAENDEKSKKHNIQEWRTLLNRVIVRKSPINPYWQKYRQAILTFLLIMALGIYCVVAIMLSGFQKCIGLFVFLMLITVILIYIVIRDYFGKQINVLLLKPTSRKIDENWRILRWYVFLDIVKVDYAFSQVMFCYNLDMEYIQ